MTAEPNNPKNNIVLDSSGYYAKPRTQFERFLDKLKPRSAALRTTVLVTFVVCFSLFMSLWFIWRTLYLPELQQHAGYLAIESEIIHNPNFKILHNGQEIPVDTWLNKRLGVEFITDKRKFPAIIDKPIADFFTDRIEKSLAEQISANPQDVTVFFKFKPTPSIWVQTPSMHGAWVREQKAGYFKRDWVNFEPYPNLQAKKRVRCWDLAFSEPSEARPRVDATAGVLMSKDQYSVYTIEDCITMRERVAAVEKMIFETAERDGRDVTIGLPKDPGATAGAYCQDLARRLSEKGFTVRLIRPERGKLQRFLPFASVAEAGYVRIVNSSWTEEYVNELEQTEFNNKTHDDRADATSDCFWVLNRGVELPIMTLPNIQVSGQHLQSFHTSYGKNQGNFTLPTFNIK